MATKLKDTICNLILSPDCLQTSSTSLLQEIPLPAHSPAGFRQHHPVNPRAVTHCYCTWEGDAGALIIYDILIIQLGNPRATSGASPGITSAHPQRVLGHLDPSPSGLAAYPQCPDTPLPLSGHPGPAALTPQGHGGPAAGPPPHGTPPPRQTHRRRGCHRAPPHLPPAPRPGWTRLDPRGCPRCAQEGGGKMAAAPQGRAGGGRVT